MAPLYFFVIWNAFSDALLNYSMSQKIEDMLSLQSSHSKNIYKDYSKDIFFLFDKNRDLSIFGFINQISKKETQNIFKTLIFLGLLCCFNMVRWDYGRIRSGKGRELATFTYDPKQPIH